MRIAIEGCCHGSLDTIYKTIGLAVQRTGIKVDLLLCCGDFQAVRNEQDLQCMACPAKFRDMHTFWEYYCGRKTAPVPTIFIGGNHEASNHLRELFYGGWVAPNIWYLGHSGVINFGGVRIAGLTGIFKGGDYQRGHFELPPYDNSSMRSAYHVREYDVAKLASLSGRVDVALSHDWPRGIYNHGNTQRLLAQKKFLREEVQTNTLGSPPAMELLMALRPRYWFSAHLHVKFPAVFHHTNGGSGSGDGGGSGGGDAMTTKFLALDKCLPGRDFLQIVDVDGAAPLAPGEEPRFQYDAEWLAITRAAAPHLRFDQGRVRTPTNRPFAVSPEAAEEARRVFAASAPDADPVRALDVPLNFAVTAEPYDPRARQRGAAAPRQHTPFQLSPQTVSFCQRLGIPLPLPMQRGSGGGSSSGAGQAGLSLRTLQVGASPAFVTGSSANPDEIDLDLGDDDDDSGGGGGGGGAGRAVVRNPDAIDLDDEEEGGESDEEPAHGVAGCADGSSGGEPGGAEAGGIAGGADVGLEGVKELPVSLGEQEGASGGGSSKVGGTGRLKLSLPPPKNS